MKILSADEIRALDKYTIEHEPVASVDLMERAGNACFQRIKRIVNDNRNVIVVCGKGNNGGDGLVIARLLLQASFRCRVMVIEHAEKFSHDAQVNYDRLTRECGDVVTHIRSAVDLSGADKNAVIIDALFGTGLSRAADGIAAEAIAFMNSGFAKVISVDIPSGLFCDGPSNGKNIVRSNVTITFHAPKLAFLVPDNAAYVPQFEVVDIGLHPGGNEIARSDNYYIQPSFISTLLKRRGKFSHKGSFGHAQLFAGSEGKSGAAVIAARACMRSGCGLLTVHSNKTTLDALLNHLPEAMNSVDANPARITETPKTESYNAVGFGPGTGTEDDTATALKKLLQYYQGRMVFDADGLNILAGNPTWLSFLPADTILTPHPGEFARLAGKQNDGFERLDALRAFSVKHRVIVILKGAHSAIGMPDGNIVFNSSGNPGLSKAGTGDALTGIILGLLARGYSPPQAAIIGTFVHGFAAELATEKMSMESLLATDVIEMLPKAFRLLEEH